MKSFLGRSSGSSRWWLAVAAAVVVALLAVGIALGVYFAGSGSGASDSSAAAPTASPTPVASPSGSPTPTPAAAQPVSPTPTSVDRPPTPYPPMGEGILGGPSCPEGWLAYDIVAASYAFCAPQGWNVIVRSSDGRMVDVWNPAFSARLAQTWPKGGEAFPLGEVSVRIDNEPKVSTVEEWTQSCDQFKVAVSGREASGCVRYGEPILGIPEDVMRVAVWIDRGEDFLIVSAGFRVSETADADKETILQLARSIHLR